MSIRMKLRRNWLAIVLCIAVLTGLAAGLGEQRVTAVVTGSANNRLPESRGTFDISNSIDLFDDSRLHSIQLLLSDETYDLMLSTYRQTGEKDWFRTDVVIDGVTVRDVGVRLKGNSSLRGALGGGWGRFRPGEQGGAGGGLPGDGLPGLQPGARPEGENAQPGEAAGLPQEGRQRPAGQPPFGREKPDGAAPGFAPEAGGITAMVPSTASVKIPLLLKFDKYVSGQTYQGLQSVAIRTYGTSYDEAMLAEPVTNAIARLAGLPAARTCYASFSAADQEPRLYVISEVLDSAYLQRNAVHPGGVLFKAEVGSTMEYVDDNPSSYAGDFTQETRLNDADMKPLIAFLRFIAQADDAQFASQLADWLDVDTFALYLAVNNLLVNRDSIAGMNNNYYLYFDVTDQRFIIYLWDTNESLGKLVGGSSAEYDLYYARDETGMGRGGFGGGMFGGENRLVTRFLANDAFKALYESKLTEVYRLAFLQGALTSEVQRLANVIDALPADTVIVDMDAYNQAVANTLEFITRRGDYLAGTELLSEVR